MIWLYTIDFVIFLLLKPIVVDSIHFLLQPLINFFFCFAKQLLFDAFVLTGVVLSDCGLLDSDHGIKLERVAGSDFDPHNVSIFYVDHCVWVCNSREISGHIRVEIVLYGLLFVDRVALILLDELSVIVWHSKLPQIAFREHVRQHLLLNELTHCYLLFWLQFYALHFYSLCFLFKQTHIYYSPIPVHKPYHCFLNVVNNAFVLYRVIIIFELLHLTLSSLKEFISQVFIIYFAAEIFLINFCHSFCAFLKPVKARLTITIFYFLRHSKFLLDEWLDFYFLL